MESTPHSPEKKPRLLLLLLLLFCAVIIFNLYTYGLTRNPPGFYIDESAFAYNAYLISKTGVSEFGVRWPLYFQNFEAPFLTYANPVVIYLLALVNLIFPPGIWLSRFLGATAEFIAAGLLGLLGFRISRRTWIGIVVGSTALVTPWLYEVGRLYFDSSYYPLALVIFLLALFSVSKKEKWSWLDAAKIAAALGLLTYTYTIGRLLAPLLAFGLLVFGVNRNRLISVAKVWIGFAIALAPLMVFNFRHPGVLTSRFVLISYVKTEPSWIRIVFRFIVRYFQDLSLVELLISGDPNTRHHVPGTTGSMLVGQFLLSVLGLVIVAIYRRRDSWWRYMVFATLASVVPAALTKDPSHTGRLIAYQVFLLVLMIPALEWLAEKVRQPGEMTAQVSGDTPVPGIGKLSSRQALLIGILMAILAQAIYFQVLFWQLGPQRRESVDVGYQEVYERAVSLPNRPIYLIDGVLPSYIHALWYATLDGRPTTEFVHVERGYKAPVGAMVISSEEKCDSCRVLLQKDQFLLYQQLGPPAGVGPAR